MRIYATRESQLSVMLTIGEREEFVRFSSNLRDEGIHIARVWDEQIWNELEKTNLFNVLFWFKEEREDPVIEEPKPKEEEKPDPSFTDYPAVKSLQEARVIIMQLNPEIKPFSLNAPVAIFKRAKELKITFSNLSYGKEDTHY